MTWSHGAAEVRAIFAECAGSFQHRFGIHTQQGASPPAVFLVPRPATAVPRRLGTDAISVGREVVDRSQLYSNVRAVIEALAV